MLVQSERGFLRFLLRSVSIVSSSGTRIPLQLKVERVGKRASEEGGFVGIRRRSVQCVCVWNWKMNEEAASFFFFGSV